MWGEDFGTMIWGDALGVGVPSMTPFGWILVCALLMATGIFGLRLLRRDQLLRGMLVLVVGMAVPLVALATSITLPYVFVNGTVADADQVNANLDELVLESNAQDSRLTALESSQITDVTARAPG